MTPGRSSRLIVHCGANGLGAVAVVSKLTFAPAAVAAPRRTSLVEAA